MTGTPDPEDAPTVVTAAPMPGAPAEQPVPAFLESIHPLLEADYSRKPWIAAFIISLIYHTTVVFSAAAIFHEEDNGDPYAEIERRFAVKKVELPKPPPPPPPPPKPIQIRPAVKIEKREVKKQVKAKVVQNLAARVTKVRPDAPRLRTTAMLTDLAPPSADNNGILGAGMPGGTELDLDGADIVGFGSEGFTQPNVIQQVEPEFPQMAKTANIREAAVEVMMTIGTDGRVKDVKFLKGLPIYEEAVLTAIRQWVFEPAKQNGVPTETTFVQKFVFRLE